MFYQQKYAIAIMQNVAHNNIKNSGILLYFLCDFYCYPGTFSLPIVSVLTFSVSTVSVSTVSVSTFPY